LPTGLQIAGSRLLRGPLGAGVLPQRRYDSMPDQRRKLHPIGFLGFLGFLGLLGFRNHAFFGYFSFFAFFAFFALPTRRG
jgi:hypothetical protein